MENLYQKIINDIKGTIKDIKSDIDNDEFVSVDDYDVDGIKAAVDYIFKLLPINASAENNELLKVESELVHLVFDLRHDTKYKYTK
jgi:hypothetical protein